MKWIIDIDEECIKTIDKIKFLVGGRTDRKLQSEVIKAIKNGKQLEQEQMITIAEVKIDEDKFKELANRAVLSVTPQEPRKGHWIEEFNDLEGEVRFNCSSCGKFQLFGTDYCYHCGSDNREVDK